ncbi:Uncharacterised protein [Mycobacteroides abscessus]|nr:Uncharacterised protein [Mycobacteroides abscessus]
MSARSYTATSEMVPLKKFELPLFGQPDWLSPPTRQ